MKTNKFKIFVIFICFGILLCLSSCRIISYFNNEVLHISSSEEESNNVATKSTKSKYLTVHFISNINVKIDDQYLLPEEKINSKLIYDRLTSNGYDVVYLEGFYRNNQYVNLSQPLPSYWWDYNEEVTIEAKWNDYSLFVDLLMPDTGEYLTDDIYTDKFANYGNGIKINLSKYVSNYPGYNLTGWKVADKKDLSSYNTYSIDSTITIYNTVYVCPIATPKTDREYTVEHYYYYHDLNINPNIYFIKEEKLTGTTGEYTEAKALDTPGLNLFKPITQIIIDGIDLGTHTSDYNTVKIYYTTNPFKLTLECDSNRGTVTGGGELHYLQKRKLEVKEKKGYTFDGWYKDDELISNDKDYIYTMEDKDVTLEAKFTPIKYKVTLEDVSSEINLINNINGNEYDCGSKIPLVATHPSNCEIIWKTSDGKVYYGTEPNIIMPSNDITISANLCAKKPLKEEKSKETSFYFGRYPQKRVSSRDNSNYYSIINMTKSNQTIWKNTKVYANVNNATYTVKYTDIDYDGDGIYDYRYIDNVLFEYQPIKWYIIDDDDYCIALADLVLDKSEFNVNNRYYENSIIRQFLLNDFYNVAFTDLEKENLLCNKNLNNQDKVFIISENEYNTSLDIYNNCKLNSYDTIGSEYAQYKGVYRDPDYKYCSPWWIRDGKTYCYEIVKYYVTPYRQDEKIEPTISYYYSADCDVIGVRPAIRLKV